MLDFQRHFPFRLGGPELMAQSQELVGSYRVLFALATEKAEKKPV
jgi:hypothetical protein